MNPNNAIRLPDPLEVAQTVVQIANQSQSLVSGFLQRQTADGTLGMSDANALGNTFLALTRHLLADPLKLAEAQTALWQQHLDLWQRTTVAAWGQRVAPAATPATGDRRFRHDDWQEHFFFDFIKQAYLLTAGWLQSTVGGLEGLDGQTQKKIAFYTRQFADALAPSNFPFTNPEVLRETVESGGGNLLTGLRQLLDDLERGKGQLRIRQTDLEAFQLGVNIATTPGKVIYQNELMQLLQYTPSTEQAFRRPLLVVPPWINKYYILDLREKNSFIKWWVDQGFTVFVISWVNPDQRLAEKGFEDYLMEGPLAALDAIEQATGEREVNAVGYCLGGTLLACALAYLTANGRAGQVKSATFLTTLLDFSEPGELGVFIDDEQLKALEQRMDRQGYLDGADMAMTFNMLRANDLIWSYFVNNYLLGKQPFPFDLLYWNSDSTRMPAAMHRFYLRNMYQHNRLKEPGGIELAGTAIDLSTVTAPSYFLATVEDHIAPWQSSYRGAQLFAGPRRFVLGGSGHIAGAINPPAGGKYSYWTHRSADLASDPQTWLDAAESHAGSWWPDWLRWVKKHAGKKVPARQPGDGGLAVIEDAPGYYVKQRS